MKRGFTLVEMMVCLLIVGLLAGAVTLSLTGIRNNATYEEGIAQIETFDRVTRQQAEYFDRRMDMNWNLKEQTIVRVPNDLDKKQSDDKVTLVLPEQLKVRRIRTMSGTTSQGQFNLPVTAKGQCVDYALEISRHNSETTATGRRDDAGSNEWLLFIGITGKMIRVDSEEQINDYFEVFNPRELPQGNDAH